MRRFGKSLATTLAAGALGLGVWSVTATGDEPADRARELIERAEQAAVEGREGQARELAERARRILHGGDQEAGPRERLADRPPREDGRPPREGRADGPPGEGRPDGEERPPRGERPDPEKMKQLREQFEKAKELRQKLHELEKAGNTEEAAKLREALQELHKQIYSQMPRPPFGGREGREGRGPEGRGSGDFRRPGGPEGPDGPDRAPEGRRGPGDRMRAVRMAAAILEQAGFPEEADRVRELGKQIAPEEGRGEGGPPPRRDGEGPREGRPPRGPEGRGDRPRGDGPRSSEELKARMERIQQEIRRINEHLEKMKDGPKEE